MRKKYQKQILTLDYSIANAVGLWEVLDESIDTQFM